MARPAARDAEPPAAGMEERTIAARARNEKTAPARRSRGEFIPADSTDFPRFAAARMRDACGFVRFLCKAIDVPF